jgi:hypothetical protein
LVWTLTQAPLQNASLAGQAQLPPLQLCPLPQALPQVPQLFGSFWTLTQVPLQSAAPDGQPQLPPLQL